MRILVLTPEYLPAHGGGIVTFYRNMLPQMAAAGHEIRVVHGSAASAALVANAQIIDGVRTEQLEWDRLRRHMRRFAHLSALPMLRGHLAAAAALWEQAQNGGDVDIVEASDWGLLFAPATLEGDAPVVVQAHGGVGQIDLHDPLIGQEADGAMIRVLEVALMQRAAAVQTYSAANAAFWRGQTGRDIRHLPAGWRPVAPPAPGPAPADGASGRGLALGRVQRWKGPHVLCEALARLGARAPEIDWVGRDTSLGQRASSCSRALAEDYPAIWGPRVRHLPQVDPQQAAVLQRAARFNLVPSTWDVFNFTCVEAMWSGRPVICSRGAGASELIEDGANGFLFDSGDAAGLADALERVMKLDEAGAQAMGLAAQETVAATLDPKRLATQRLEIYATIVADHRLSAPAPDDWLRSACCGRDARIDERAFLDHMPLRPLLDYGARRLLDKLMGRARG